MSRERPRVTTPRGGGDEAAPGARIGKECRGTFELVSKRGAAELRKLGVSEAVTRHFVPAGDHGADPLGVLRAGATGGEEGRAPSHSEHVEVAG